MTSRSRARVAMMTQRKTNQLFLKSAALQRLACTGRGV